MTGIGPRAVACSPGQNLSTGGTIFFLVPQSTTPCCLSVTRSKWHILLIAPFSLSIPNYWEIMNIEYLSITSCFHIKKIQSCPSLKAVSSEYHPSPGPNSEQDYLFPHVFLCCCRDERKESHLLLPKISPPLGQFELFSILIRSRTHLFPYCK